MISTVKLYKDSKIIDGRNFIVDDIADYLATLTDTLTLLKFQYIKHSLTLSIKVNKSQTYLDYKASNDYNYCSIQNSNEDGTGSEKIIYYFIDKMNWLSENTIKLDLIMDTINTFRITTDFTVSGRTTILRSHRDRYKLISAGSSTQIYTASTYCRIPFGSNYTSQVTITTEATSVTVNSVTSNANTTTYSVVGSNIIVTVTHDNPDTRILITVDAGVTTPKTYQRIIDPVSEGINSLLFKTQEENISDNNNLSWYLIYKNKDDIDPTEVNPKNPIDIQLRASEVISVKQYSNFTIEPADFNDGDYLLVTAYFNDLPEASYMASIANPYSMTANGYMSSKPVASIFIKTYIDEYDLSKTSQAAIIFKDSGHLYIAQVDFVDAGNGYMNASQLKGKVEVDYIVISGRGLTGNSIKSYANTFTTEAQLKTYRATSNNSDTLTLSAPAVINSINLLDRTDSKIIKIIACPYCPTHFDIQNQYYIISGGWEIGIDGTDDIIKLTDVNIDLINNIETNITSPIAELYNKNLLISTSASRDDNNESKLLHSDYYQPKIVYDSFSYLIALENLDPNNPIFDKAVPDLFKIDWMTANTINSRFLAKFPQLKFSRAVQDFENLLYINRNNEIPIYNSTYLNYLRTGYNYDVKTKNAAQEKANEDLWLSIISAIGKIGVGIGTGAIFGNVGGAIAGGITSGVTATSSIVSQYRNAAYNIARQEDSIAQKLAQAKATAVSVSSADDVNILMQYSPVAKSMLYKIGSNFEKAMADLFYYCGYRRDVLGTPDFSSRYWFNFVEADLVIATANNIPSDILADIVGRFKEGVTNLHHHTTWDFDQVKENWEVSLL